MTTQKAIPDFMIRVKLPSSGAYHCSPSGDTEYEEAYRNAIIEKLPEGFEVIRPLLNQKTPQDSEGFTWIRIKFNGKMTDNPQAHWIQECQVAQKKLRDLETAIRQLPTGR